MIDKEKGNEFEQKAKRLGVKLIPARKPIPPAVREELLVSPDMISDYMKETIAVCGACGNEISRQQAMNSKPCGSTNCPFGIFTNEQPTN